MPSNTKPSDDQSDHPQEKSALKETSVAATAPEEGFPERLAALRDEKGLKHDSLSELTKHVDPQKKGIARTTLRGYELGVTKPGIRELRVLSQALGVSINKLVFGTENFSSTIVQGQLPAGQKTVLGKKQEDIVEFICFIVALYRMGNQDRDAVYHVASSLAAARLGEVEYRKLMDATRDIVETFIDAHSDALSGGVQFSEDTMKKDIFPLINATLEKFGFAPGMPTL